uniref:Tetraspanin n=1 Tax=Geodia cydonium TaxID=6047 RepID=O96961_GEOCY|nr:tetraspanin-CD63 receptor [Geodia cydonium]
MGGQVKLHPCGHCLRFTLIFWNIFVLLIGVAALAVGIWQVVENDNYSEVTGSDTAAAGAVSIVGGIIAIGVALLGIIGAIALSRILIGIYAVIIVIFIIIELASGIVGFVFRDRVESTVSDNAVAAIENYYNSTSDRRVIDAIQNDFDCCGWNNYTDYTDREEEIPTSCICDDNDGDGNKCIPISEMGVNSTVYTDGCRDSFVDFLREYQLVAGAIGITFAVIQIAVVLISIVLCLCIHRAKAEYTTV